MQLLRVLAAAIISGCADADSLRASIETATEPHETWSASMQIGRSMSVISNCLAVCRGCDSKDSSKGKNAWGAPARNRSAIGQRSRMSEGTTGILMCVRTANCWRGLARTGVVLYSQGKMARVGLGIQQRPRTSREIAGISSSCGRAVPPATRIEQKAPVSRLAGHSAPIQRKPVSASDAAAR